MSKPPQSDSPTFPAAVRSPASVAATTGGTTGSAAHAEAEAVPVPAGTPKQAPAPPRPKEIGGPKGPEPTRFGDWERDGRCVDF